MAFDLGAHEAVSSVPKDAHFNSSLTALSITPLGHLTYCYEIAVIDEELRL
ncbi:hypothetical protein [Tardiphaga robiniae]|uniref:hypothetical protein n=1 Tax=Tardiphaga robiniae TaxID=943830 RepID=UPI00130118D6|nr:hypothetical protein [Tardiphaga robiniae]